MPKITLSDDCNTAMLAMDTPDRTVDSLNAAAVDRLIADLAAARAQMRPAFSGRFRAGESPAHACDNLLWETQSAPSRRGVCLAFQHPGLGWISLSLSRAQVEDLITGIEFTLADMQRMPGTQKLRLSEEVGGEAAPADPVPRRRIGG